MTSGNFQNTYPDELVETGSSIALGESFIKSMASQNFEGLKKMFQPVVRFRAMVPSGERQGNIDAEAVGWLEKWFGKCDTIQIQQSSVQPVFDRLYLNYRLPAAQPERWLAIDRTARLFYRSGWKDRRYMAAVFRVPP